MASPSLRRPAVRSSSALTTMAAQARKADRHLVADLNRSMFLADRAMRRLGAVERHALVHLRSVARARRHQDPWETSP